MTKLYYDPKLKALSRELRKRSTLAEVLLWNQLKGGKMLGLGFLRQKPIHLYIVDFYCPKLKLVIEIDGGSHREKFASDRAREGELEALGLSVLRFADRDVKRDLSSVMRSIQSWIEQRLKRSWPGKSDGAHPPAPLQKGNEVENPFEWGKGPP